MITLTGLNLGSAGSIGKAEDWIVGLKVAMLFLLVGFGLPGITAEQIAPPHGRRRFSWRPAG